MGDFDGAIAHQRRAIELDPAFWRHHWSLGVSLLRSGSLDEAEAQFNRAIRLQPESPFPYSSLGAVYFFRGEYLKAGDAFRESIRRNPNPQALSNAGTNYFYAGDYVQAEEMFRQAATMSPSDYRYRGFVAEAVDMQGTRDAAEVAGYYEAAVMKVREQLAINPGDHVGRAALASYLARLDRTAAAEAELATLQREQGLNQLATQPGRPTRHSTRAADDQGAARRENRLRIAAHQQSEPHPAGVQRAGTGRLCRPAALDGRAQGPKQHVHRARYRELPVAGVQVHAH